MHYRSATIYGRGTLIEDAADKAALMEQVFASLVRSDRLAALPPLQPGYLAGTMVVSVSIDEAVGKVNDSVETSEGPDGIWSGIISIAQAAGAPLADERTANEGIEVPPGLAGYRRGADRP